MTCCPNCFEPGHPDHHVITIGGQEMFVCIGLDTSDEDMAELTQMLRGPQDRG